ncbi:Aspartate/glutamate/uridylate kinase [Penicillium malachiteum]|uniref:Aspartate/glutamate/uridylate kinase n=1 Tax=Penicillium malachiteum TaxID=1324776 RepID=UPI0025496D70|nr:Aspartate/glutamate/uridylate kinase [Penicillium malachiteum]KAJ5715515.1 Aspartate/glutamate/uridylate kinase [Penicillium malachiteum]
MLVPLLRRFRFPYPHRGGHFVSQFSTAQRSRAQTNRDVIAQLLSLIDSKHQIQRYLERFHPSQGDALAARGLIPIVVHGELGLDLDLDIASDSTIEEPINQSNHLRCIRTTNHLLSALLEHRDVETRPISSGVFTAVARSDRGLFSHEANMTGFIPETIESAIRAKSVPIVATLGTSSTNSRTYALDAHNAAIHLARVLQPPHVAPSFRTTRDVRHDQRRVRHAISLRDFPSKEALRLAFHRHIHPGAGISIDALMSQLETRDFAAYFDHDSASSSPEQTIHNLALVFPRASFPWNSPHLDTWDPSSAATSVENAHRDQKFSEIALFAISQPGWQNGVAEQFWNRIRADHGSLWGSLPNTDPSLSWWLSRSSGALKRRPEKRVYMWHGLVP